MKNLALLPILVVFMAFSSCSKDDTSSTTSETGKFYTVSLGFSGEITNISESDLQPKAKVATLKSANTVSNNFYGIQIYSTPVSGDKPAIPYACGVFDDLSKMNVKLMEGYKYNFVCKLVQLPDERLIILNDASFSNNYPFLIDGFFSTVERSVFYYSPLVSISTILRGKADLLDSTGNNYFSRPNINTYIGYLNNYIPENNDTATINLIRNVFGIKITAKGLTNGTLSIQLEGAPLMTIKSPNTEVQDIITFDFENCSIIDLGGDYYEDIPVIINWKKADEVTVPITSQTIRFHRNKLTTIVVDVKDSLLNNSLGIVVDSDEITIGDTIVVNGSSGSDTNVNPTSN
ncbi:MAG TPA: hypothetical protein VIK86_02320 [Candidatus Paceibacterota bacterium]